MKLSTGLIKFAGGLSLVLGSLSAMAADQAPDEVTLKNGQVVQGEIVEEKSAQVEILVNGDTRTYSRDLIAKISYGGEEDTPAAVPAAPPAVPPGGDALTADLAMRYRVPESSVIWVRRQGISNRDLPVVLAVAAAAAVPLRDVVDLRLRGWSWHAIRVHFGLAAPGPHVVVVAPLVPPPPILLRILLFPFFLFGHWR